MQISTQWVRAGMSGRRTSLDYRPALELMKAKGWDIGRGIALLSAIEREYLERDESERAEQSRD